MVADADLRGQLEALPSSTGLGPLNWRWSARTATSTSGASGAAPAIGKGPRGTSRSYKPTPGALMLGSVDAPAELLEAAADFVQRLTASSEA